MHNEFFSLLKKEHEQVKGILEKLTQVKAEDNATEGDRLMMELKENLIPHMKAEEQTFYEKLMDTKEARCEALEGLEEHHVADLVLREIEELEKDDERWHAKISLLKELITHHVQEEEGKIFQSAEKALDHSQIQQIMKDFEQQKQQIKQKLGSYTSQRQGRSSRTPAEGRGAERPGARPPR